MDSTWDKLLGLVFTALIFWSAVGTVIHAEDYRQEYLAAARASRNRRRYGWIHRRVENDTRTSTWRLPAVAVAVASAVFFAVFAVSLFRDL